MKAVYVGAGLDIRPLIDLSNIINDFHYIDSLPFSIHGTKCSYDENHKNIFSRNWFLSELNNKLDKIEYKLQNSYDNLLIYENTINNIKLYYHINTSIPEHIQRIQKYIQNFDYLIVAGHDPHMNIIFTTNKKIDFIGYYRTSYSNPLEDNETIIYEYTVVEELYKNTINKSFNSFTYIDEEHYLHKFNNWYEFVLFYYS